MGEGTSNDMLSVCIRCLHQVEMGWFGTFYAFSHPFRERRRGVNISYSLQHAKWISNGFGGALTSLSSPTPIASLCRPAMLHTCSNRLPTLLQRLG